MSVNESLSFNVHELEHSTQDVALDVAPELLDLSDEQYRFEDPVQLRYTLQKFGKDVLLQGEIATTIRGACARTLEETSYMLATRIDALWTYGTPPEPKLDPSEEDEDDGQTYHYTGEIIDPSEVIREFIMLALPDRIFSVEIDEEDDEDQESFYRPVPLPEGLEPGDEDIDDSAEPLEPDWKTQLKQLKKKL